MNKKIALSFFILVFPSMLFCQNALIFTEVIQVDNTSKEQLFDRAKMWFTTIYRSSSDVLQIIDKDNGQLVGKAAMTYHSSIFKGSEATKGDIRYQVSIFFKDNRYKYEFTNFIHEGNSYNSTGAASFGLITDENECPRKFNNIMAGTKWCNNVWTDLKEKIDSEMKTTIESLKSQMINSIETENSNW